MVRLSVPKSISVSGLAAAIFVVGVPAFTGTVAAAPSPAVTASARAMPAEEFSPALLGIYRKVSRIEGDIVRYADKYDVDVTLARAVCMFESGGNPGLTSVAGARGYFQVMPATFRTLRVPTNIEAGIKYLGQLVHRFGREDYALAAYNGGPARVALRRPMPLESLQYVMGVSVYRSVLKAYEGSVRPNAAQLSITTVRPGEDWWALSRRLHLPVVQLRLHNPFLAARTLKPGALVAYPPTPRTDVLGVVDGQAVYHTRLGDNYLKIAFMLGVDLDTFRDANRLWRLEPLLPGTTLEIPADPDARFTQYDVEPGDTLTALAQRFDLDPWILIRDNHLWNESLDAGEVLQIRRPQPKPKAPVITTHVVGRGETLSGLAVRYGTTVARLQAANGMGRRTLLHVGQRLRIPQ